MIGDISLEPIDDGIFLQSAYIVNVDLGEDLNFKFEDWNEKKFGIFFFDDMGLGIPIMSMGYCMDLSQGVGS